MANVLHQYAQTNPYGAAPTPRGPRQGSIQTVSIPLAIGTGNLADGDLWKFIKFNERTAIYEVRLATTELDEDATPTLALDLGYDLDTGSDDVDYWIDGSTTFGGGGAVNSSAATFAPGVPFTIQAEVTVSAATAKAGEAVLTITYGPIVNPEA